MRLYTLGALGFCTWASVWLWANMDGSAWVTWLLIVSAYVQWYWHGWVCITRVVIDERIRVREAEMADLFHQFRSKLTT